MVNKMTTKHPGMNIFVGLPVCLLSSLGDISQQTGDGQLVGPKMGHEGVTIGPSNANWMVNVTENTSNSWFPGPIALTIT